MLYHELIINCQSLILPMTLAYYTRVAALGARSYNPHMSRWYNFDNGERV